MGGLAKKMPLTGATTLIGSMSIAGVPPFSGFWSKLLIIIAAVGAGRYGYAFVAVLVSVLTLGMYAKVMKHAFFGALNERYAQIKEVPPLMRLAMGILAIICIIGGVLVFPGISTVFLEQASGVVSAAGQYARIVLEVIQ